MAKTIGGTDGMHKKPDSHPFKSKWTAFSSAGKARGAGLNGPGGPKFVAANSAMKGSKKLNGPGTA